MPRRWFWPLALRASRVCMIRIKSYIYCFLFARFYEPSIGWTKLDLEGSSPLIWFWRQSPRRWTFENHTNRHENLRSATRTHTKFFDLLSKFNRRPYKVKIFSPPLSLIEAMNKSFSYGDLFSTSKYFFYKKRLDYSNFYMRFYIDGLKLCRGGWRILICRFISWWFHLLWKRQSKICIDGEMVVVSLMIANHDRSIYTKSLAGFFRYFHRHRWSHTIIGITLQCFRIHDVNVTWVLYRLSIWSNPPFIWSWNW